MVGEAKQSVLFGLEKLCNKSDVLAVNRNIDEKFGELKGLIENKIGEIDKLKIEVDKKLNEFYREFTDKYFDNLNSFMRWNKDLALASKFKDDKDFSKLKRDMLLPFIKADWEQKKALSAIEVDKALSGKGGTLIQIAELLEKQVVVLEREEKPVKELKDLIQNIKDLTNESTKDIPDSPGPTDTGV